MAQYKEANRAIDILHYLQEQGLVNDVDFTWKVDTINHRTDFIFHTEHAEMYATLIPLKFL